MREGGGRWEKNEEDSLEQVRLQIMLPGGYLIDGASRTAGDASGQESADGTTSQADAQTEPVVSEQKKEEPREKEEPKRQKRKVEYIAVERPQPQERIVAQESPAAREAVKAQPPMSLPPVEGLKEDKWEQILDTYDCIHPYGDERIYVKLEPKDFLILSSKYQHLVNNSFLLHGFYNYRHVALGKEKETYYLGVPGVFYEREKMVALMFGFEAFECAGGEPKAGEFGYYLRQVEL